jgi:ferredoxin
MKIKFVPTGKEIEGDPNKTLLQLCTENGIEIKSICKGVPSCAECRIRIVEGEYNVVPPTKAEMSLVGTNYFVDQRRLSCQVRCFGDVTVDLKEQIERSEIQNKKVRGFRAPGQKGSQVETHAKQGTLVLEEGAVPHRNPEQRPHTPGHSPLEGHPEDGHSHPQQTEGRAHEDKPQQPKQGGGRNSRGGRRGGGGRDANRGGQNASGGGLNRGAQGSAGGGQNRGAGGGQNRNQGQAGGGGQNRGGNRPKNDPSKTS